jgi:hypothetical protein
VDLDVDGIRAGLRVLHLANNILLNKIILGQRIDNNSTVPLSVCSLPCEFGFYRAYQDQTCCWTCIPCDTSTSIIPNETR